MTQPGSNGNGNTSTEEQEVRRLLEEAGARPEVPAQELASIKAAFREEWRTHTGTRPGDRGDRRRPLLAWRPTAPPSLSLAAIAAAVLITVTVGWWWSSRGGPGLEAVAVVQRVDGGVAQLSRGVGGAAVETPLEVAAEVLAGARIATDPGQGRVALRLAGGASLRLTTGSRVVLAAADVVELERGALYVDSRGQGGARPVSVHTSFGVVREIGTQFEVRLVENGEAALRVRVREGEVEVEHGEHGEESSRAKEGEELTLRGDGSVLPDSISSTDGDWDWVLAVAPVFEAHGRTVEELLAWVARETGWEIRFENEAVESLARSKPPLQGNFGAESTPAQAAETGLRSVGLGYRLEAGALVVTGRPPA